MRSQRAWLRKGIANEFSIAICFCRAICRALGVIAVPYSRSFVQAEERSFGRRSTQTSHNATSRYRSGVAERIGDLASIQIRPDHTHVY